jgi:hypothetical protein
VAYLYRGDDELLGVRHLGETDYPATDQTFDDAPFRQMLRTMNTSAGGPGGLLPRSRTRRVGAGSYKESQYG